MHSGAHEVGPKLFAWMQPDGSWGLNNAGLIEGDGQSLLVDTLFDKPRTRLMLAGLRQRSTVPIRTVVNTHANGDHCWGNDVVTGARVIASRAAADEMAELPPRKVALLTGLARVVTRLGPAATLLERAARKARLAKLANLVVAAPFVDDIFGAFDLAGTTLRPPDQTFTQTLALDVGGRAVRLVEVGPAHTAGDVLVFVDDTRVVYAGDIVFMGSHPIVWRGPVSRWVAACERILAFEPTVVVPGHGPLTDGAGVARLRDYLVELHAQASARFHAGVNAFDASIDIARALHGLAWSDAERTAINVETVYRELDPARPKLDEIEAFARMAQVARALGTRATKVRPPAPSPSA